MHAVLAKIIGTCFQIRDDIFDYFPNADIGKPTYNDMNEGKTYLAGHLCRDAKQTMRRRWNGPKKVKNGSATRE